MGRRKNISSIFKSVIIYGSELWQMKKNIKKNYCNSRRKNGLFGEERQKIPEEKRYEIIGLENDGYTVNTYRRNRNEIVRSV